MDENQQPHLPQDPQAYGLRVHVDAPAQVTQADTFHLQVQVTWEKAPHAWLLLPQTTPETQGLRMLSQSSLQKQGVIDGKLQPSLMVDYRMIADSVGKFTLPTLQYQLPLADGGQVRLSASPVVVQVHKPFCWGAIFPVLLLVALVGWVIWRKMQRRKFQAQAQALQNQARQQFLEKVEVMAGRVHTAKPDIWLKEFFELLLGNIEEPLLNAEHQKIFAQLSEAYAQARYGGGPRDAWENKEWLRLAKKLIPEYSSVTEGVQSHG